MDTIEKQKTVKREANKTKYKKKLENKRKTKKKKIKKRVVTLISNLDGSDVDFN